jgi:hypothetical protein
MGKFLDVYVQEGFSPIRLFGFLYYIDFKVEYRKNVISEFYETIIYLSVSKQLTVMSLYICSEMTPDGA